MHNLREAYRRVYEALGTKNIDAILKPTPPVVPEDPATENAKALQMQMLKAFPEQDHQAHIHGSQSIYGYKNGSNQSNGLCFNARTHF